MLSLFKERVYSIFRHGRLINIALRTTTLATRFLFIFALAKSLDPADVGYYGLFTASVSYCIYLVGLDFYVYTTREVLLSPKKSRGVLIKSHAALSLVAYIVFLPIIELFLSKMNWPSYLLWWLAPILLLEHFNQEVSRLLIAFSKQIAASVLMFVRQGSWAILILILMWFEPWARNLSTVMAFWALAGAIAAGLGLFQLRSIGMGGWREPVDWRWLRRGVLVSGAFLIATLALRGLQTIDRHWLEVLGGIEIVGAYVLFLGVASALMVFLDASVFSFAYPRLISCCQRGEYGRARNQTRRMFFQTLAACLSFGVASWLLLPLLLDWVGSSLYRGAIGLYPWVLAAMVLNALGMVPHYALYARGLDRPIVQSHLASLPVFALTGWCLSGIAPILAVPAGVTAAFAVILLWKTVAYYLMCRNEIPVISPKDPITAQAK